MAKVYANLETSHFSAEPITGRLGKIDVAVGLDYGEPEATFYISSRPKGGEWYEDLATGLDYTTVTCPDAESFTVPIYANLYGAQEVRVKHYDTNGYQGEVIMEVFLEAVAYELAYEITQDDMDNWFEAALKEYWPAAASVVLGAMGFFKRFKKIGKGVSVAGIVVTIAGELADVLGPETETDLLEVGYVVVTECKPQFDGTVLGSSWIENQNGDVIASSDTIDKPMEFFPTARVVSYQDYYFVK